MPARRSIGITTQGHIEHCLREFDSASGLAQEPAEVELALWFHDAVYDPYSSDNEAKSTDLACELLNRHGVSCERVERVRTHVREEYRWVPGPLFRRNLTAAIAALRGQ